MENHLVELNEMVSIGSGAVRKMQSYKLSRYACYLIVQNADPSKEVVALGQTYFEVGKTVRKTIEELGGTMPEELHTADSIKKLEKVEKAKAIKAVSVKKKTD